MTNDTRISRPSLVWAGIAALLALFAFASTAQVTVNGSQSPYATDVGELQNALPRWGTLHFTGYPLYSLIGSAFVSLLRAVGIAPAAGASMYSALWGSVAIFLFVLLLGDLGISPAIAAIAGIAYALTKSLWIDASLAEVHTMTMALSIASMWLAVRYGRFGRKRDLAWLAIAFTQGMAHQRAVAFLALAILLLIWPHRKALLCNFWLLVGLAALAPLTYLYLPIRAWMGADWTFGQPGTWYGFWAMILDTKSQRIIALPHTIADWWARIRLVLGLLTEEMSPSLLGMGLVGLLWFALRHSRREAISLTIAGLAYMALGLIVWEGHVSDALLAVQLPAVLVATLGLTLAVQAIAETGSGGRLGAPTLLAGAAIWLAASHRPQVLAITRDASSRRVVEMAQAIERTPSAPTTLMALWGHDYWALTYAQAYEGELAGLNLVDHNADFEALVSQGQRLLTFERTFYERPLAWWEERLGTVRLASPAPGIIKIIPRGQPQAALERAPLLDLGNGIDITCAKLAVTESGQLALQVTWSAQHDIALDYSVAVHLLAQNPPAGPQDILAQADRQHPVGGWYPTCLWREGEVIPDCYVVPLEQHAVGIRIGMYRALPDGSFENSQWLFLPIDGPA